MCKSKGLLYSASALSLLCGLSSARAAAQIAAPAHAELPQNTRTSDIDTAPAPTDNADAQDVVVTGTRVVRNGYSAPTPTTVVGSDYIEERAPLTVVDALATLPSFRGVSTPSTGSQAVASTLGASFLNLRGLGANRTLLLLDGGRVVPTTTQGLVDVAIIPTFIIKRVDVVTGGASASWGSDAVAGVANFVIDHDFRGAKVNVSSGVTERGDGQNYTVSGVFGTRMLDERLHVIAGAEYYDNKGVPPGSRGDVSDGDYNLIANPAYTPPMASLNDCWRRTCITPHPLMR